jgi:hypothetical protein
MDALERLIDDTQEAPPSKEGLPGEFNRPAAKTKAQGVLMPVPRARVRPMTTMSAAATPPVPI